MSRVAKDTAFRGWVGSSTAKVRAFLGWAVGGASATYQPAITGKCYLVASAGPSALIVVAAAPRLIVATGRASLKES
jgi:hypothetical protein